MSVNAKKRRDILFDIPPPYQKLVLLYIILYIILSFYSASAGALFSASISASASGVTSIPSSASCLSST